LTSLREVKSKIGTFLHAHVKRYTWVVFEQILSEWSLKAPPNLEVSSGLVDKGDFSKYAKKFEKIVPSANERFASGDLCFGAMVDGTYVHLKWIALNRFYDPDTDRYIQLGSDSAYVYDGYTLPEYRGLGLTSIVLDETFRYLSKVGIKKVYSLIDHNNAASMKVKSKEKAHMIGTVTYVKIFGLKSLKLNGETKEDYKKLAAMFSR